MNPNRFTSYEAQIDYYTQYIKKNTDWTFVDVYTDEGISGTNAKHRAGFNKIIADALAGKIDLIVTKSISRFARNTVDTLTNVRTLKEHKPAYICCSEFRKNQMEYYFLCLRHLYRF